MKRKLEVLLAGLMVAATMILAGCVADTGDDEEADLDQAPAALVTTADGDGTAGGVTVTPRQGTQAGSLSGKITGNEHMAEPEPNPWTPAAGQPGPGDPGGPNMLGQK